MSPCSHSCTGLERCGPACAKPIARSSASVSGADARVDADLHEREAVQRRAGAGAVVLEEDQRAHRVDRGAARVGLAEDVVEDLQRQRAVVAGGQHAAQQTGHVQRALPGEAAVVAAPLQDVHRQVRRVRELEEEDLLARDAVDRVQRRAAAEDVERVQAGAQRGVVGGLDDPPRMVVGADVAAPGERLVGDLQATLVGAGGERVQVLAARASSSIACGWTFEQTSTVGAPRASITSNFASARRKSGRGTASKSRNGW